VLLVGRVIRAGPWGRYSVTPRNATVPFRYNRAVPALEIVANGCKGYGAVKAHPGAGADTCQRRLPARSQPSDGSKYSRAGPTKYATRMLSRHPTGVDHPFARDHDRRNAHRRRLGMLDGRSVPHRCRVKEYEIGDAAGRDTAAVAQPELLRREPISGSSIFILKSEMERWLER